MAAADGVTRGAVPRGERCPVVRPGGSRRPQPGFRGAGRPATGPSPRRWRAGGWRTELAAAPGARRPAERKAQRLSGGQRRPPQGDRLSTGRFLAVLLKRSLATAGTASRSPGVTGAEGGSGARLAREQQPAGPKRSARCRKCAGRATARPARPWARPRPPAGRGRLGLGSGGGTRRRGCGAGPCSGQLFSLRFSGPLVASKNRRRPRSGAGRRDSLAAPE